MTWRAHCRDCGTDHEPAAHRSADAMEREAARRTADGDALGAAIWRARAACTRAGHVVAPAGQMRMEERR